MPKYSAENEILAFVHGFETGTIARADWGHAEHLMVALFYLSNHEYEIALEKMRDGIFNLLQAFEIDLAKEMPYHETLTIFWMRIIDEFRKTKNGYLAVELCGEMEEKFDKDYPLKFYSRELLFSDDARINFIAGDLGTF